MATEAKYYAVGLAGDVVGHLVQVGDFTKLEWREQYWQNPARPMMGLYFEDHPQERVAAKLRLPAWFSNVLPEGLLRVWVARQREVSVKREMELLAEIGHDLPGGVSITALSEAPRGNWELEDFQGAVLPASTREDGSGFRFSLAGVGLKFSLLRKGDRLTLPAHDELGDWIVKMPDARFAEVPRNEFASMQWARSVGIEVPRCELRHRDTLPDLPSAAWPHREELAFVIERFDRDRGHRIHMEDFAQVRGFYPDDKYHGAFETLAALSYRRYDEVSLEQFIRRLAFCFLIGNGDMHHKNWTLLYRDPRRPVLSPAYDLLSTAAYAAQEGRTEDFGLKLNGDRRFEVVSRASFIRLAHTIGAPRLLVERTLDDFLSLVEKGLPEMLQHYDEIPLVSDWLRPWVPRAIRCLSE